MTCIICQSHYRRWDFWQRMLGPKNNLFLGCTERSKNKTKVNAYIFHAKLPHFYRRQLNFFKPTHPIWKFEASNLCFLEWTISCFCNCAFAAVWVSGNLEEINAALRSAFLAWRISIKKYVKNDEILSLENDEILTKYTWCNQLQNIFSNKYQLKNLLFL